MRNWTPEERAKQADACRRNKPWTRSTGPKTRAGKARSRMNALKTGNYTPHWKALRRALLMNREFVRNVVFWTKADYELQNLLRKRTDKK